MRIIKDFFIKKYHSGFPRKLKDIREVTLHHTEGNGSFAGLKKWMLSDDCNYKESYKKGIGFTPFYIDKKGSIYQIHDFKTGWSYHSCAGKYDKYSIGIEIIHKTGSFTDAQYKSINWLVFEYLAKECPNLKRVVGHDYNYTKYSNNSKGCPSSFFDWANLVNYINKKDFRLINVAWQYIGFRKGASTWYSTLKNSLNLNG